MQSALGQGQVWSFPVWFPDLGEHFYLEKNFYNFWDTNQMPSTRATCRSATLVFPATCRSSTLVFARSQGSLFLRLICHWVCSNLMSPKLWSSLFSVPLLCNQYNLFWWCLTHLLLGKFPKGPKERTLHLEWMYQPQHYVRALSPRALSDKSKSWTSWEEESSFCSQMSSFICLQASWYLSPLKITLSIKKCICYVKWIGFEECIMKITGDFFQYRQGNCRSPKVHK